VWFNSIPRMLFLPVLGERKIYFMHFHPYEHDFVCVCGYKNKVITYLDS